jgi:bifunctional DNA-binding transcriptional regulator/antitoxin component of YhaV-PrlF toxin-antitoxin module
MTTVLQLDTSNRLVLPRELRRAAGISARQKFKASVTPGRIVLELPPSTRGQVINRGRLKLWTGPVPATPLGEAVDATRHYER